MRIAPIDTVESATKMNSAEEILNEIKETLLAWTRELTGEIPAEVAPMFYPEEISFLIWKALLLTEEEKDALLERFATKTQDYNQHNEAQENL